MAATANKGAFQPVSYIFFDLKPKIQSTPTLFWGTMCRW